MTHPEPLRLDDLLGEDGLIGLRLEGYEERDEQVELAKAIEAALAKGHHLLAEAGTGIGKSFAYLLPAILRACATEGHGPVVVSTRTIALQEQLELKDIPFLQAVLPLEFSAFAAVGRNHYLCLRRMHHAQKERGFLFGDPQREAQLTRVVDWSLSTHDGLRMELSEPVDDLVWDEVRAEHGNCLYRACKHYDDCPYQRSRRRIETAQVLIVNHALYMADVALRAAGAQYLPEHRVVIFDEAHHLERVATEGLGLRLSPGTVLWHLNRLHGKRKRRSLLAEHGNPHAMMAYEQVRIATDRFFLDLDSRMARAGGNALAIGPDEVIDEPVSEPLGELASELSACAAGITNVDRRMEMQSRVQGLQTVMHALLRLCRTTEQGWVRWLEPSKRGAILRAAPLDISETMREHVFGEGRSCVLLSATMGPAHDQDFGWMRRQLGIDECDTLRLGSPFDYRHNVQLTVVDTMPDPVRDPAGYTKATKREVRERVLANGGRALVLCTSWRLVRELAEALREPLAFDSIELLVQGEAPLRELLRRKRDEPTSVLLGTETFWEGIDVPGDALTLVIVTRFPFAQPDHPLTKARLAAIAERGGDPFGEHSLPEAVLKFRQGFGRLVRSANDRGEVVILDPRARTRRYGRAFLEALPDGVLD